MERSIIIGLPISQVSVVQVAGNPLNWEVKYLSEETRKYSEDADVLFEKLKKLSRKAGFQIDRIDETNKRLNLSTGMSPLSFGENVEVIVNRERDGSSKVFVSSKPKVFFNITANPNRNVRRVIEALEKEVH